MNAFLSSKEEKRGRDKKKEPNSGKRFQGKKENRLAQF